jgi:hypothetical protein
LNVADLVDLALLKMAIMLQAVETALAKFASEGLVVAVEEGLGFSIEEWNLRICLRVSPPFSKSAAAARKKQSG